MSTEYDQAANEQYHPDMRQWVRQGDEGIASIDPHLKMVRPDIPPGPRGSKGVPTDSSQRASWSNGAGRFVESRSEFRETTDSRIPQDTVRLYFGSEDGPIVLDHGRASRAQNSPRSRYSVR